jgi:hypothetical protein
MSFDNALIFTGRFITPVQSLIGKTIKISATSKHSDFELKITGQTLENINGISSIMMKFSTIEERDEIFACDFNGDIFTFDE